MNFIGIIYNNKSEYDCKEKLKGGIGVRPKKNSAARRAKPFFQSVPDGSLFIYWLSIIIYLYFVI